MSLNPYHYTTQPRHGLGAPGAGDFDRPSYLGAAPGDFGAAPGDYGFAPLLGVPLWAWLAGLGTTAASVGGAYMYGKGAGSTDAAALAAAAQAGGAPPAYTPAAPPPGYTYPPGYYTPAASAPGAAPPPDSTALTDQPWFWPALIATAGVLAFAAFRPRS